MPHFVQTGDQRESAINHCSSSPCQNGGVCENKPPGYSCTCAAFYTGRNCELTLCQVFFKVKKSFEPYKIPSPYNLYVDFSVNLPLIPLPPAAMSR